MSALSDALNEANKDNWSSRELARRANDRVSHTQLAKYFKPDHPRPSESVLRAFAEIFPSLTIQRLRMLAGRPPGESDPYQPPPEADLLNVRQRKAVDELIRSIVSASLVDHEDVGFERTTDDVLAAQKAHRLASVQTLSLDEAEEVLGSDETTEETLAAIAARRGEPKLRGRRAEQDRAGEAPDSEGPEAGA